VLRLKSFRSGGNTKCPIVIRIFGYGYSKGFVSRLGKVPFEPPVKATLKDSDINTISIISGFKAADVSTPENTDKVITLITNKSDTNVFKNMLTIFTIVDGADAKRFTLKKGNKLTFKATAFKAQSNT
jgi:hypothetical protein